VGLIFRSALPEELEWENRTEDVALSLDAIKRCLLNMLTALDRDTPQLIGALLQENFTFTRNLTSNRVLHAAEGVQWVRMEDLGKALTNRCRAVRELQNLKTKKFDGDQRQNYQQ